MLAISTPTLWGYRNQSRFHTKVSSMNDEDIFGGTWKYLRRSVNISESFLLKSVLIPKINFVTLYTGIRYMSIPFQTYFETDLRCSWKNNAKTLRFPKLCLYQWCHIQWEVDYAVIYFYVVCRQDYASVNLHGIGSNGIVQWCMSLFLSMFATFCQ